MALVEATIQPAVIHWVHETYPHIVITSTSNEKHYKQVKQIGLIGISDLILFDTRGRVLFLELKRFKGKLSPQQIEWLENTTIPHPKKVAYGFAQAREIITLWVESDQ